MKKFEKDGKTIYVLDKAEQHICCSEDKVSIKASLLSMLALLASISEKITVLGLEEYSGRLLEMAIHDSVDFGIMNAREKKEPNFEEEIDVILNEFFNGGDEGVEK